MSAILNSIIGFFFPGVTTRAGRPRGPGNAPCMTTGLGDVSLPEGATQRCTAGPDEYIFSFFAGPCMPSPEVSVGAPFEYPSGTPGVGNVQYRLIQPFRPGVPYNNTLKYMFQGTNNRLSLGPALTTAQPVNMTPFITPDFFTAYKFPSSTDTKAIITPGPQTNNTNVKSGLGLGLTNTMYIDIQEDCSMYIEIAGGRGGTFPVYANGVNSQNQAIPLTPGFIGGTPGTVFGVLSCRKGDIFKVALGSVGIELDANQNSVTNNNSFKSGQGGIGTIFGGANGGGASYIVKHSNIFDAYENINGEIIVVAGGGGGASRNASGGFAGSSADGLLYGGTIETRAAASAGGLSNVVDLAPLVLNHRVNGLSGGGGSTTVGGLSSIIGTPERNSCWGQKIQPFEDSGLVPSANGHSGGASVITFSGTGGGGGGGGFYGGGAGAWNLLPKPNNLHGAGGGGSSFSLLKPATRNQASINVYRQDDLPVNNPNNNLYGFGFLVLGIKSARAIGNVSL
jgi:hypothetical protein